MKKNIITTLKRNYMPLYSNSRLFDETDEELKAYKEETEYKLSRKKTIRNMLGLKEMFPKCSLLFDTIIGNTRYLDKIVFVTDGSYRMNRIWIISDDDDIIVEYAKIGEESRYISQNVSASENPEAAKKAYKEICNNYEKIFIQFKMI